MSDILFQWVMPIGSLSAPVSLEETTKLIRSGRIFPPQLVSVNGEAPLPASQQVLLYDLWTQVLPPESVFDGQKGRVTILSLGRLFAQFALSRSSGRLLIRHGESGIYFSLRFVSGQLLEVNALDPSTYIGQMLLQRQKITPSQLVDIIEYAKEQHTPIGKGAVALGFISDKGLNQLLAEQMFARIRKIACFPYVDVCFYEDDTTAMIPPVARISGYSLLEITLGYGLSDQHIKTYIGRLLNQPIKINRQAHALKLISAEDRSVLKKVDTSGSLDPLKERGSWTQRDSALKAISWDLMSLFDVPASYILSQEYGKLTAGDSLSYLGLDPLSPPHVIQQTIGQYKQKIGLDQPATTAEEEHVKRALSAKLKEIVKSLEGSERERRAYQRLKQLGADLNDQNIYKSVLFDICIQDGEAALKRQRYAESALAYREALLLRPNDLKALLHEVWTHFLDDSRNEERFKSSKAKLEQIQSRFPQSPLPPLFLARVYRLFGDLKAAEENLRHVLELAPDHNEAKAELRLLFNRDFDKKNKKLKSFVQINPESGQWIFAVSTSLLLTVVFWALGSFITHPRDLWPEERPLHIEGLNGLKSFEREQKFNSTLRTNYELNTLASAAYRLGLKPHRNAEPQMVPGQERPIGYKLDRLDAELMREMGRVLKHLYSIFNQESERVLTTLRQSLVIPAHLRVIGNVEHYWLQEDLFGWGRRLALLLIGLFGLYRLKPKELKLTPVVGMSLIAVLYGTVIGYLSPAFTSPTDPAMLSGMKLIHSLGEVVFFQFFLGAALLRGFSWSPYIPVILLSILVAIFKLSYLNIWYMPTTMMVISILQIGIFIGGGCFIFMWKSKSYFPPLLAHLALTFIPMLRGLG